MREKVETREGMEEDKHEEAANAQTRDIMDDMQMEWMRIKHFWSPNVECAQDQSVREKVSCELYLSTLPVDKQSISIDCKRNQL